MTPELRQAARHNSCYRAMIASAPAQPAAPDRVSVPVELLERAVGNGLGSSIKAIGELRVLLEGWKV